MNDVFLRTMKISKIIFIIFENASFLTNILSPLQKSLIKWTHILENGNKYKQNLILLFIKNYKFWLFFFYKNKRYSFI